MVVVTPMVRLWQIGAAKNPGAFAFALLFEAVAVPLVWATLSFVLVRRGPWKVRIIAALLLCSTGVALGFAIWTLASYTIPTFNNPLIAPGNRSGLRELTIHVAVILGLAAASLFLVVRIVRRPRCTSAR
jgi:hypothetical protein